MTEELSQDGSIDGKSALALPDKKRSGSGGRGASSATTRGRNAALRSSRKDLEYLSQGVPEQVEDAPDESKEPVRVELLRGNYIGLGCPDPDDRLFTRDTGNGYTHDHPAMCVYEDFVSGVDHNSRHNIVSQRFVHGEIIQLFPLPEHEAKVASTMRAEAKRFTFSRREAVKRADEMVALGNARSV